MDNMMFLIRGVPGSGKTTMAQELCRLYPLGVHFEADQFFLDDNGIYRWNPALVKNAHKWCQEMTRKAAVAGTPQIIVSNTFVRQWEMDAYWDIAEEWEYKVITLIMDHTQDVEHYAQRNIHQVPVDKIQQMLANWEH